jgi:hypothetical protein
MHDDNAFERQVRDEALRVAGPSQPVDDGAIFGAVTASQSPRWRPRPLFTAVRFVVAATLVALFGGILLRGLLTLTPDRGPIPATGASASAKAVAPVAIQPVEWVAVEDVSAFTDSLVQDVAVSPRGEAVIVGSTRPASLDELRDGLAWSRAADGGWRRTELPDALGAYPRRVVATEDGFVAIGRGRRAGQEGSQPVASVWTSRDGVEWSSGVTFDGAEFTDLDSVNDTIAVTGTQQGIPTVWISRSGGPWDSATIDDSGRGFSPDQLAVSADGIYLVRDSRGGRAYRSEDGHQFTTVDLPGRIDAAEANSGVLVRVVEGFAIVIWPREGQYEDLSLNLWLSPDGLEWRRGEAALGLAPSNLGIQRAAALMVADRADLESLAPTRHLSFLQADGTWCAVSPPAATGDGPDTLAMARNEDGTSVIVGTRVVRGPPEIWLATGVRCEQ